MAVSPGFVEVSQTKYDEMERRLRWLDCLEAANVSEWEGVEVAQDFLNSGELHVV